MIGRDEAAGGLQPLKVLLLVESANAGTGRHVCDLCEGLRGLGHEVHLAYAPARADERFRQRLKQIGASGVWPMAMRRGPGPWDLSSWWRLMVLLRRLGPFDVVHGHSSKAGALARLVPRGQARVRVYTPHAMMSLDPDLGRIKSALLTLIERRLARRGDALITVSEHERRHVIQRVVHGLDGQPSVHCIYNGVATSGPDPDGFSQHACDRGVFRVGFIGRFAPQKAPEVALAAFARFVQAGDTPAELVVVGGGPLGTALRRQADALGIGPCVRWVGAAEAASWLPRFSVLLAPSRYEGLPYLILEAMAAGTTVVATRVGGVPELIQDGQTGLLVEPDDVEAMARVLVKLAEEPGLGRQLARAGRQAVGRFGLDGMVTRTLAVYRSRLETAPGGASGGANRPPV